MKHSHGRHTIGLAAWLFAAAARGGAAEPAAANAAETVPDRTGVLRATPLARDAADLLDDPAVFGLLDRRTETAIRRGLDYLRQSQSPRGIWGPPDDRNGLAYQAFGMIAFMLNGHFPNKKAPYGECMSRALDAMLIESKGQYSGYLGTTMYAHGLGTVALSEAWGQSDRDDDIREALKAAVRIILGAQNQAGGWRYNPQPGGADVSVTAMQVVALASARQAGIFVPDHTIGKAVRYISLCRNAADGGFAYMPGPGVSGYARTAAASFSMMMLGQHDAQDVKDGVAYLRKELKANMTGGFFMYGMYYATLCFYQSGDADFRWWYPQIRDALLAAQQPDGSFRVEGRPYYDTPIALVILSVPYAYVPAYQR